MKNDKEQKEDTVQAQPAALANAVDGSELEKLQKQYCELKDLLQRMQAEFDNYRKRVDKEKHQCRQVACLDVIIKLLPVLDSFDQALKNSQDKGTKLLYQQLWSILESFGLRPIECIGNKFDPHRHEVLLQEQSDMEEGTILEELQKGYALNSMIIRPSKVKVSKNAVNTSDKGHTEKVC